MLFVLHCANHPELTYRGGQGPIVHLEADLGDVVSWANASGVPWAFSVANAGANYVDFYGSLGDLDRINWEAVAATDFRSPSIKEGKQAKFLVRDFFPWRLVERIGVQTPAMRTRVLETLNQPEDYPLVEVRPSWYY